MMNKLTAEKCRGMIKVLKRCKAHFGLEQNTDYQLQALEIALPILEQQEQKQKVGVREGLAALSAHIDSIGGYNFEALEAYRREEFGQQERDEDEWIYWVGNPWPPATGVVDVRLRSGLVSKSEAGHLYWHHNNDERDIIAYRIIPERATNQNGEQ